MKKDETVAATPERFGISQNYPNPFNPITTIRFEIAKTDPVSIQVYNLLGEEVATLVSEKTFTPGTYTVTWDASEMASGVYLYKFKAGNVIETKKMMLLK